MDFPNCVFKVRADIARTKKTRKVTMACSPALERLLRRRRLQAGPDPYVFGDIKQHAAQRARHRIAGEQGVTCRWKDLRSTCSTYSVNSSFMDIGQACLRQGHTSQIALAHYLDVVNVEPAATTLESAMGIADVATRIIIESPLRPDQSSATG